MLVFFDLNDNCVTLNSLLNKITGDFVNDAVASVTIKDLDGIVLINAQPMPYVAASDGVYRTVIDSAENLGDGRKGVTVEVNATAGDGSVYHAIQDVVPIQDRALNGS